MNSWINLNALWKIVVLGLLAGAGLPALFAVGLRALAPRAGAAATATGTATAESESRPGSGATAGSAVAGTSAGAGPAQNLLGKPIAGLCFVAVVAAMVWGVVSIVQHR